MKAGKTLFVLVAAGAVVVAAFAAPTAGGDRAAAAKTRSVRVDDDFFRPKRPVIARGDRVRWVWRGTADHNVRFRKVPRGVSRRPGSRLKDSGRFSRKLRKRGTYRYVCTIHEDLGMTGSIRVR